MKKKPTKIPKQTNKPHEKQSTWYILIFTGMINLYMVVVSYDD